MRPIFASLTAPVYGATGQPSLKGMLGYLQDNWLLELGIAKEALQLITTDEGCAHHFRRYL